VWRGPIPLISRCQLRQAIALRALIEDLPSGRCSAGDLIEGSVSLPRSPHRAVVLQCQDGIYFELTDYSTIQMQAKNSEVAVSTVRTLSTNSADNDKGKGVRIDTWHSVSSKQTALTPISHPSLLALRNFTFLENTLTLHIIHRNTIDFTTN